MPFRWLLLAAIAHASHPTDALGPLLPSLGLAAPDWSEAKVLKQFPRGERPDGGPTFWTLLASEGSAAVRLEMTSGLTEKKARRRARRRLDRLASPRFDIPQYPGDRRSSLEAEPSLKPVRLEDKDRRDVLVVFTDDANRFVFSEKKRATRKAALFYLICPGSRWLAEIEVSVPAEESNEDLLDRANAIDCAVRPQSSDGVTSSQ